MCVLGGGGEGGGGSYERYEHESCHIFLQDTLLRPLLQNRIPDGIQKIESIAV